uniref:Uncharacterized protein n=1 Tax=Megaselia scalaris TaxID=36166 RepID=T1GW91_MEGSC
MSTSVVRNFIYLGAEITSDNNTSIDVKVEILHLENVPPPRNSSSSVWLSDLNLDCYVADG